MRVLIAPDSFKECLSAAAVSGAIARGWRAVAPDDELLEMPLADGGEGTTEVLVGATGGSLHRCTVTGPLGEPVAAHYGLIPAGALGPGVTAVVEVAEASGLARVPPSQRDALRASSRGTGELIQAALAHRPSRLIVGLGGSASTDAGAGLMQALGASFCDASGQSLPAGGAALSELARIDVAAARQRLHGVDIVLATDVSNDLLGVHGSAAVFAPQKGASASQVKQLAEALEHYAAVAARQGWAVHGFAGAGAAGGIAGTLAAMLGARIESGAGLVMQVLGLAQQLSGCDLVITGEGSLDAQTAAGKTVAAVCRLAQQHGVPVIGLAGRVADDLQALHELGLTAAFAIAPGPLSVAQAMDMAPEHLAKTAGQLARLGKSLLK